MKLGYRERGLHVLQLDAVGPARPASRSHPGARPEREARSPWIGIQRTWTLRKNTMPVGPQYSIEFGNTSMSMNGLQVLPRAELTQLAVSMAQPERRLPLVHADPNSSNSKVVLSSPSSWA